MRKDGSYVGRSAPEIDVFEALVSSGGGQVKGLLLYMGLNDDLSLQGLYVRPMGPL